MGQRMAVILLLVLAAVPAGAQSSTQKKEIPLPSSKTLSTAGSGLFAAHQQPSDRNCAQSRRQVSGHSEQRLRDGGVQVSAVDRACST